MNKLARFLSIIFGLSVITLYWFDWNLCERGNPGFDGIFWNNYVVFFGYAMFVIVFFKNLSPDLSYTFGAVGASIVYGILIGAYKRAGAECGELGEGMDKVFYYNTETYPPFLFNNIALFLYAFFSFWQPKTSKNKGEIKNDKDIKTITNDKQTYNQILEDPVNEITVNDSLIHKYKVSDQDLKRLHLIEKEKEVLGVFSLKKEKLKGESLKILKPYNVKFMDLGSLLNEIKNLN